MLVTDFPHEAILGSIGDWKDPDRNLLGVRVPG